MGWKTPFNPIYVKFDSYSFRARVLPMYLVLAPAILLFVAVLPRGLKLPLGGAGAVVFLPIAFLLSQIGADMGKRLERRLWEEWGGPPTSRFLRHGNDEFNEITRARVHLQLRALGLSVPVAEEQEADARRAEAHFESCTEDLIRRTRNVTRFPLVHKGLTEYGFRRNLLGLKPLGLIVGIGSLLGIVWWTSTRWIPASPPAVAIVTAVITVGLLAVWLSWVTPRTVKTAANRYARYLLEAAMDLP